MHGIVLFIAGLILLSIGAEMILRSASRLATSLGIEPLILGLTVVSIGTSMPELAIGITASREGRGALAVGNIAGANMINILFVLGLSALLRPLPLQLQVLKLELPVMVAAAVMMTVLSWDGVLTPLDGGLLFGAAILYTVVLIRLSRSETQTVKAEFMDMYGGDLKSRRTSQGMLKYAILLAGGMGLTVLGADWLVDGAVDIARAIGLTEAVIGLTIVAIGTTAPELVTTVIATIKDDRNVAIGNLLGSSIYNILVVLGLICIVSPGGVPVEERLLSFDLPLMAGVALLCIPVFVTGKRLSRLEGGAFITFYAAYILWLIFSSR